VILIIFVAVLVATATLAWPKRVNPADRLARLAAAAWPASRGEMTSEVPPAPQIAGDPALGWPEAPESRSAATAKRQMFVVAGCVALMSYLLFGDALGIVVGTLLAIIVVAVSRRREAPDVRRRRERISAELPFAVELMVACLRAGQPVGAALDAAAHAVGGPLGERLAWVGSQVRLGAEPRDAWATLAGDGSLAALSRTMTRAVLSGAPVADALARLSEDARQQARATASAAARRVGVQVVAPLGLCFLPAFVLLGIVPVVAGLMGQIVLP
jgi:pilus assembly protein TadC